MSSELHTDAREQVRLKTDIVGLLGESLNLQPRYGGREYVALCPFHDDHDPSLRVYPDRQTFRCWVCNEGGDVFTWIMKREAVGFREALEILARRAGVPIERTSPADAQDAENKARLFEVLTWAEGAFHQCLQSAAAAEPARTYLQKRGFTAETIRRFRIGYHPNDWEWLQKQARGRFTDAQLAAVRLVGTRDNGRGSFDHFVDRVVFPIRNERGQVAGFGGRVLPGADDSHGKYWNSPESPVFFKSRMVYGLDFARDALRQTGVAVVTEGYTDCIMCHQHGLTNVVGTLGTALTDQHVATLKRFINKVVLVYDGDEAGQRAAGRAVERFVAQDVDLRVLTLPDGLDPDEFLSAHGVDAWRGLVAQAPEAWTYRLQAVRRSVPFDTIQGRQQACDEMLRLLNAAPRRVGSVRENLYLADLAQQLGIAEAGVRERFRELQAAAANRPAPAAASRAPATAVEPSAGMRLMTGQFTRDDRLECNLLEGLFAVPEFAAQVRGAIGEDDFQNPDLRRLYAACGDHCEIHGELSLGPFLAELEDSELKRLAVWLDAQAQVKGLRARMNSDVIRRPGSPAAGHPAAAGRAPAASSAEDDAAHDGCPLLLRRSIENLHWRREEQSHQRIAQRLSATGDGTLRLDAAAEALLRQAAEFHQRRATPRPPV